MWERHFLQNSEQKYQVIAAPGMEDMAKRLTERYPNRFLFHSTSWKKFADGTDQIAIGGFQPKNRIAGQHVLMLASFHNNDVTLSQFSVMITLLQSFIKSLTVVLPYYPVGTMERITEEGTVATANTYAQLFSNLPTCGQPTRLLIYDLHTLQNRFYLHQHAVASLQTAIPVLLQTLQQPLPPPNQKPINCIVFPDDGASKRFRSLFASHGYEMLTCAKTRTATAGAAGGRQITLPPQTNVCGKHALIVDDLVQSGGTLYECAMALRAAGAERVSAYATHAVFPNESWKRFLVKGDRNCFDQFYVTNSIPTVTDQFPPDDVFTVLDLTDKIVLDLDTYS